MAPMGQVQSKQCISWIHKCQVHSSIGRGTRMRLNVDPVGIKQFLCSFAGEVFNFIYMLTTTVISFAGIAFGIFIGQNCAHRRNGSSRHKIFRGDQLKIIVLSFCFLFYVTVEFRVLIFQYAHEKIIDRLVIEFY